MRCSVKGCRQYAGFMVRHSYDEKVTDETTKWASCAEHASEMLFDTCSLKMESIEAQNETRRPTQAEIEEVSYLLAGEWKEVNREQIFNDIYHGSSVVFPNYSTGGPGYAGKVMVIVWDGSVEFSTGIYWGQSVEGEKEVPMIAWQSGARTPATVRKSTTPREATKEEIEEIRIANGKRLNLGDESYAPTYVAVWDRYMPDGPSYSGKVAVVIWGEVCFTETFVWVNGKCVFEEKSN